jgi:hypothetical protein
MSCARPETQEAYDRGSEVALRLIRDEDVAPTARGQSSVGGRDAEPVRLLVWLARPLNITAFIGRGPIEAFDP